MRVFLAHSNEDLDFGREISAVLRELGHDPFIAMDDLVAGASIYEDIKTRLSQTDIFIVLWSENARKSSALIHELGYFFGAKGRDGIVTIIRDNADVPVNIAGNRFIDARNRAATELREDLQTALAEVEGRIARRVSLQREQREKVEESSEAYIEDSLNTLNSKELNLKRLAFGFYGCAFICLTSGVVFAIVRALQEAPTQTTTPQVIQSIAYAVIVVGLLAAAARFSVALGKSFMVESIRNSDRQHAIKFGQLYLRIYRDDLDWSQIKEAFQHWNIDTGSTFHKQDANVADPQIVSQLSELLRNAKEPANP